MKKHTVSLKRRMHRFPLIRKAVPVAVMALAISLLVPNFAYAGILGDFLDIDGWICNALVSCASWLFNLYFAVIGWSSDTSYITGNFANLFGSATIWNFVETAHQTVVIPLAESILALFMLVQLVKISQRIDATATLPAVKEIVFLAVAYVIFHWLIVNSLDIVTAIFDEFNRIATSFGSANSTADLFTGALNMDDLDLSNATIGGCFMLVIFALLSVFVGIIAYLVSVVVSMARAVQLYVMAAFSPIPLALLGFDETRQMGVGFLKNFCAAALAGAVMLFLLVAYPYIVTSTISSIGSDSFASFVGGSVTEALTAIQSRLIWLAMSILLIIGLVKSGGWAKEILGG